MLSHASGVCSAEKNGEKVMHQDTYMKNPMGIEMKSFEIIEACVADQGKTYPMTDEPGRSIYNRVIHTSADFDYLDTLKIDAAFLERFAAHTAVPLHLYTDTHMALSGINKRALEKLPWTAECLVAHPLVREIAEREGITRSMAAVQMAMSTPGKKLFVFGNAPTSIFRVLEYACRMSSEERDAIVGIIGVPVGFVGAAESKQALYDSAFPSIVALGRKGGSNVAAAIVNALMYHYVGR